MSLFLVVITDFEESKNIWLPDRKSNNSHVDTMVANGDSAINGESPSVGPLEGAATIGTNDGCRLYVGNLS